MQVVWTDPALERVDEIAVSIAQDDPAAAARCIEELFDAVARLIDFPESERTVPELGARRVREVIFGAYRVFYRVGLMRLSAQIDHGRMAHRFCATRHPLGGRAPTHPHR